VAARDTFPDDARSGEADRQGARARLLESAGQVFAEQGFEAATGKEIAERAGANAAGVNYHFGSLEGLYAAVLAAARDRLVASETFAEVASLAGGPEEKLRTLIRLVVRGAVKPDKSGWALRVIGREVTAPSQVGLKLLVSTVGPRVRLLRSLVGELVGRSEDDPEVALACISIVAPLQLLLIADPQLVRGMHPALDLPNMDEDALVEHFFGFAMAGLARIARRE
jgi:AcrR family transcriptional regulator